MNKRQAIQILDKVRRGITLPQWAVNEALIVTGDLAPPPRRTRIRARPRYGVAA